MNTEESEEGPPRMPYFRHVLAPGLAAPAEKSELISTRALCAPRIHNIRANFPSVYSVNL